MNDLNNFLNELKNYGENYLTKELFSLINQDLEIKEVSTIKDNGIDYLILTNKNPRHKDISKEVKITFYKKPSTLEILKRTINPNHTEEVTRTTYSFLFTNNLQITRNIALNFLTPTPNGYQVLIENRNIEETFTKKGYQKSKKTITHYHPSLIFIPTSLKENIDLLVFKGQSNHQRELEIPNLKYFESKENYKIFSTKDILWYDPSEVKDYAVVYENNKEKFSHPLFFNCEKEIIICSEPITHIPYFPPICEIDDNEITCHNHSYNDLKKFLQKRKDLCKLLQSNNSLGFIASPEGQIFKFEY